MKVWITTIGTTVYAVVNTIWGQIRDKGFIPDKIYIIYNDEMTENLEKAKKILSTIGKDYRINWEIIGSNYKGNEILPFARSIDKIVQKHKNDKIAFDVTAGRKYMSALFFKYGFENQNVHHIFYTHLLDNKYLETPLPLIPQPFCKITDLKRLQL